MTGSAGPVGGGAGEEAPVLHHAPADVDVTDDLSVDRHVLPHHVPAEEHTTLNPLPLQYQQKLYFQLRYQHWTEIHSAEISSPNNAARGDKENYTILRYDYDIIV